MSKELAAKVMQEIFSKGTYEGDLLGINEGGKMSDTPITNGVQHNMGSVVEPHYVVDADFSRYLERELAEAREELNDRRKFAYAVEQALDGMKGDYVEIIKELRKDAERYWWLRKGGIDHLLHGRLQELDDNIDAAMKEGK
jgi:hypothetical protein